MVHELTFPDPASRAAWADYLEKERMGSRSEKLVALEAFVAGMDAAGSAAKLDFVGSWGRTYLDGKAPSPLHLGNGEWMRLPLFRGVFAHALEQGRLSGAPNFARWTAQMYPLFSRVDGLQLPSRDALWREALQLDPGDERSRLLLVHAILSFLDYALHELPHGLLAPRDAVRADANDLAELLEPTVWRAQVPRGRAALYRIADGRWTPGVLRAARKFLALQQKILRHLGLSV